MGLFDKLFGKKNTNATTAPKNTGTVALPDDVSKALEDIYKSANKDMRDKLYYGGVHSAKEILVNICRAGYGAVIKEKLITCNEIYIQVWVRSRGGLMPVYSTPEYIRHALVERFRYESADSINKCVDMALNIIYANEPQLREKAKAIELINNMTKENAGANAGKEDLSIADAEYGLKVEKPVFVNGFAGMHMYLNMLRTASGNPIVYNRLGSTQVKGIAGCVDIYKIQSSEEKLDMLIYICNYGNTTSKTAPKGLSLAN